MEQTLFDLFMQAELEISSQLDFEMDRIEVMPELNELGALYNQNCCNYILSDEGLKEDWPVAIQEMAFLAGAVAYYHYMENRDELMKKGILQMYIGEYKNIYKIDEHYKKIFGISDESLEAMRVAFTILAGTMCSHISELVKNKNIPNIQAAIPDLMMSDFQLGINYGKHLLA